MRPSPKPTNRNTKKKKKKKKKKGRSIILAVRFNKTEYAAYEEMCKAMAIPPSTQLRIMALKFSGFKP